MLEAKAQVTLKHIVQDLTFGPKDILLFVSTQHTEAISSYHL